MPELKIVAEPGSHQILMTREFNAPAELVYRAFTDPDLLVQWLGPHNMTMIIDRHEYHDGGIWRFIHRDPEGNEAAFHGVIHGTPSLDGIVRTFEYEGYPGHISMETLTFEPKGEKSVIHINSVFQSVEDRDGTIASGMERGMNEGLQKLDALFERMQQSASAPASK